MGGYYFFGLIHSALMTGLILCSVLVVISYYFKLKRRQNAPVASNKSEEQKIILPLRLQAYERIILFLERISPNNIVMRLNEPDMTAVRLQSLIVKTIREEFEYNLSQQIYISATSWEMVRNAKEETIRLVNMAAGKIGENESSGELVRNIFELAVEAGKLPVDMAIDEIRKEVQKIFPS
jgi:hypothetical protein